MSKPILLLGIDSLRADILLQEIKSGKLKEFCTFLEARQLHLSLQGFSHAGPTQLAHPSVMAADLPLDNRGYQYGVLYASQTIPELLTESGFVTLGFATNSWLDSSYGYDRGFDSWYPCYDPFTAWTDRRIIIDDLIRRDRTEQASEQALCRINHMDNYLRQQSLKPGTLPRSTTPYHNETLQKFVLLQSRDYAENNTQYMHQIPLQSHEPEDYFSPRELSRLYSSRVLKFLSRFPFARNLRIWIRSHLFRRYPDLQYQFSTYRRFLLEPNIKPKFAWLFLEELHDQFWFSFPSSYNPLSITRYLFLVILRRRLLNYGYRELVYRWSLRYVLTSVCRSLSSLPESLCPALVVYSDHGAAVFSDDPEMTCSQHKQYLNVPLVFPANIITDELAINGPISTRDIKSIISSIASGSPFSPYQGPIIFENTGRGACDPLSKSIFIGHLDNGEITSYEVSPSDQPRALNLPHHLAARINAIRKGFTALHS